jgi:hypothetical protein
MVTRGAATTEHRSVACATNLFFRVMQKGEMSSLSCKNFSSETFDIVIFAVVKPEEFDTARS